MRQRYFIIFQTILLIGTFLFQSDVCAYIDPIPWEEMRRNIDDAILSAQQALASTEKEYGTDHPRTADALHILATMYKWKEDQAKAIPLLQRALDISEKNHLDENNESLHVISMNILLGLADAFEAEGDDSKALSLRTRAGPLEEAYYLQRQAREFARGSRRGEERAISWAQRALAITEKVAGPNHVQTANTLETLAEMYSRTSQDPTKAIPLFQRALKISEKERGFDHSYTRRVVEGLARAYRLTGDDSKALYLQKRSDTIGIVPSSKGHGTSVPIRPPWVKNPSTERDKKEAEIASSLCDQAAIYFSAGDLPQTEALFQQALTIREKVHGPEHPKTLKVLRDLGVLYYVLEDYKRAIQLLERAQQGEEKNVVPFLWGNTESQKYIFMKKRQDIVNTNVSLSLAIPDPRAKALGLTDVLQYKGRVLNTSSGPSELRFREPLIGLSREDYRAQRAEAAQVFSAMIFHGPGSLSYPVYQQRLERLALAYENLQRHDFEVRAIDVKRVKEYLPANSVLVEWFRYRRFNPKAKEESDRWSSERYVGYVLKRDSDVMAFDLGPVGTIDDLVKRFRQAISKKSSTDYHIAARNLYNKVFAPLQIDLLQNTQLLLSPDGALNLVPFAALLDENGKYLIQCCEITYLNSGSDLVQLDNYSPLFDWPLVVANPNYGRPSEPDAFDPKAPRQSVLELSRLTFVPLPGTAAEAKTIQSVLKFYDDRFVKTGVEATETLLRKQHSPKLLHLATHGFFLSGERLVEQVVNPDQANPESIALTLAKGPLMRSGLALAGANLRREGESDDGILTSLELSTLDLRRTQLVVLSACDTGLGTIEQADGIVGLRRALALAGSETQVVSLWIVEDIAVQPLMEGYYTRLHQGEGRSEALRRTQLEMLNKPVYQHPYFWAMFISIGNWRPLHD